ncbi:catalase core domain-containing protein [Talaromyces proteolyticus]|uniref:Catalase core domain-containing protein n=1 Tax=Talaromyces proteolyticus TaxID=1131652 RepID=A0AAD4KNU9_9EURO|nr:catalase core domain-containing protein [Talaromyces proteolyticus]KAH8692706.1 catalase core domain-containing protein [Talaromyces proteolyticus]
MEFFTKEGNQDWVFSDIAMFFIRGLRKFPSLNRSHKRHHQTNLVDPNIFHTTNQEGIYALMFLLNACSGHTYEFTKLYGIVNNIKYVKIHLKSDQSVRSLTRHESSTLMGHDIDHHTRDLFQSIVTGQLPSWPVCVQVMTQEEVETYRFNVFDMTKVWPHADFPLRPIGKLTLNENVTNQLFPRYRGMAFSPSAMVPGIVPSADPTRTFAYPDPTRYRPSLIYQQLPSNASISPVYFPYKRESFLSLKRNYGSEPNYVRSLQRTFISEVSEVDFVQPRALWQFLGR